MSAPINRRAALGGLVAGAVSFPAAALIVSSDELSHLIAAHRRAREAFNLALEEEENAGLQKPKAITGLGDCDYALSNGKERLANWIDDHAKRLAEMTAALRRSRILSEAWEAEFLTALETTRLETLGRLDDAFAAVEAASERSLRAGRAEDAALEAVCACRCVSPEENARKFRYLWPYSREMSDEQVEAIFRSFAPDLGAGEPTAV